MSRINFDSDNVNDDDMNRPINNNNNNNTYTDNVDSRLKAMLNDGFGSSIGGILYNYKYIWISSISLFLYYILGFVYYTSVEGWNFLNSIYFVTISLSGIGYGVFTPTTDGSRVFTAFYDLFGVILFGITLNCIARGGLLSAQNWVVDKISPSIGAHVRYTTYVLYMMHVYRV